jgi:hypothetical protein
MGVRPFACIAATLVAGAAAAWGWSFGPPEGFTGAPGGESTCAACHGNLDTGNGSLRLVGPDHYVAGDTLSFQVALEQAGQRRWGFELTAIVDGAFQGAGRILVTDSLRTQLGRGAGREYLKHTLAGTDLGIPDVAPGWAFRWIAPATGTGTVRFYAAANAANGDGTRFGDFAYKNSWAVDEVTTSVLARTWGVIKQMYRVKIR